MATEQNRLMKKKIAIVGIGRWGKNLLREFNKLADVSPCFHKGSKETKEWLSKNYPAIKTASSYDEILMDKTVEAVIIASPSKTHFQFAKKALEAGKNVFLEKPPTLKISEAEKLYSLAGKKKLVFFVGNIMLHHPVFKKLKKITAKNEIKFMAFNRNKFGTFDEDIIWNLAWHEIILAIALMGKPKGSSLLLSRGILTKRDIVSMALNFTKKRWCAIAVNRVSREKNRTVTIATKNKIYLWADDGLYEIKSKDAKPELIFKSEEQPLAVECAAFLEKINETDKYANEKAFNLEAIKIISRLAA